MKKSILRIVSKIAVDNLSKHPELLNFPHFSFVIQKNKVVEWAINGRHEPSLHLGYHRKDDVTFRPKFHSEIWAWKKAKGLLFGDTFEIVNIRLNRKGQHKFSRPCGPCFELLSALGCSKFYYSSEVGFLHS